MKVPTLTLSRPPGAAPWESDAVRNLGAQLQDPASSLSAMVLEGPRGTLLQAVGAKEDNAVATHVTPTRKK